MAANNIIVKVPAKLKTPAEKVLPLVETFIKTCQPLESQSLYLLVDNCTGALFCECHIRADTLILQGTVDVPLDPDEQPEYRANRELVEDHAAYERMKVDAQSGRAFSNLVTEFRLPMRMSAV